MFYVVCGVCVLSVVCCCSLCFVSLSVCCCRLFVFAVFRCVVLSLCVCVLIVCVSCVCFVYGCFVLLLCFVVCEVVVVCVLFLQCNTQTQTTQLNSRQPTTTHECGRVIVFCCAVLYFGTNVCLMFFLIILEFMSLYFLYLESFPGRGPV